VSSVRNIDARLRAVAANGADAPWSVEEAVDWRQAVVVPTWLPRRTFVAAVSQLYHGEIATAAACRRLLAGPVGINAGARACLEIQIADETRHARAYQTYLARLGDIAPAEPAVAAFLQDGAAAPGDSDLGAILAYHVVLEGEALRIQHGFATWLPCPVFRALNGRIARDEARHVGFGRIYLASRLAVLPVEERRILFQWVKALWRACAESVMDRFRIPGVMTARIARRWLESRWQRQVKDLAALGLIGASEVREAARL
jgi:hypothetical protein